MTVSFAPLEGITGWVYRKAHHKVFPGIHAYYTPFSSPTADSPLAGRGLNDVLPEHNEGVPLIPQLLTNKAEDFLVAARALKDLGYQEVNLNLGCPSGTVFSKKKGSGFLTLPAQLDEFLDKVFSLADVAVSIKTRIGAETEEEWPALLEIFDRYPIHQLTIHPRLRKDFYREPVRPDAFAYAVEHSCLPLCYNGDLFSPADCQDFAAKYPGVPMMVGRGLVCDPALVRVLDGGSDVTGSELEHFHDLLVEGYAKVLYGDRPVLGKMKELWFYMSCLFPEPAPYLKQMRKARTLAEYTAAAKALFRSQQPRPEGWFRPH